MEWKRYTNGRVYAHHPAGFIMIRPDEDVKPVPIACPVCECLLRSRADEESFTNHGCCERCGVFWVQPNRERWAEGWRPTAAEVAAGLAERPMMTVTIVVDQKDR